MGFSNTGIGVTFNPLCIETTPLKARGGAEPTVFQSSLHWDKPRKLRPILIIYIAFNPLCIETSKIRGPLGRDEYGLSILFALRPRVVTPEEREAVVDFQSSLHWDLFKLWERRAWRQRLSILFALRQGIRQSGDGDTERLSILFALRPDNREREGCDYKWCFQSSLHWDDI